jgi:predicted nucleic acid-binding protein
VPKYLLDTNCYLEAARRPTAAAALTEFASKYSPFLYLSSVVAAELLAGTLTPRDEQRLRQDLLSPFERRGRLATPGPTAWDTLGRTLAQLVRTEGLVLRQMPRSFMLDILLAATARDLGATYVTHNRRDAERIARLLPFAWVEPYPA